MLEQAQVVLKQTASQQAEPQPEPVKRQEPALKLVPALALQIRQLELRALAPPLPQLQPVAELVAALGLLTVAGWALLQQWKRCC